MKDHLLKDSLNAIFLKLDLLEKKLSSSKTESIFLSSQQSALYLGISLSSLYKLSAKKSIPFSKPGGKQIKFLKEDLDSYLSQNKVKSRLRETINLEEKASHIANNLFGKKGGNNDC